MKEISRTTALLWMMTLILCGTTLLANHCIAQGLLRERTFHQSKAEVEKALNQLQPSTSGRLPALDGFVRPGDRPLERFQRGYYQCSVEVSSATAGGILVVVRAKITAWYADPTASKSGYQVLPSNGRIESDFLDRLGEALGDEGPSQATTVGEGAVSPQARNDSEASTKRTLSKQSVRAPVVSAPAAKTSAANSPFKLENPLRSNGATSAATQKALADKHMEELSKEAKGLEEILHNQAHPDNLVAVKKSGTPVLASPIEGSKVLFLATAEDEFEILDTNANWVHVRISGLSRGWIRRSSLEMPEGSASSPRQEVASEQPKPQHFEVKNEQTVTFPGTWEPLQGKTVKILTVQEIGSSSSETGAGAKSNFAKSLFEKQYAELAQSSSTAAGVVLIFDSEDGGMVAATLPTLAQWKGGTLSDQAFWRRCFLDPPEMFGLKPGE